MLKSRFVSTLLVAAAMTWTAMMVAPFAANAAEECPRSFLDARYCDRDGNLTADLPLNEDEWVDPDTIIFSYTPVEDPAVYQQVWDGFVQHMAETTGRKVVFFPVQSYAAQYEAMRSGRLHVAGVNTGGNPIAVACAGFVPFAMMASKDGSFGYEMEIIVPADSPIGSPADLKGKSLAFTSPTSNSGFKAPSAILKSEFGLEADKDFKAAFSGKHDNSVLGVANKDYEAAGGRQLDTQSNDRPRCRGPGNGALDLSVADLPDDRLRPCPQPAPHGGREDQAGILHVPLGGVGTPGRVQEGRQIRRHLSQVGLGHHPQDRHGERRELRLQVRRGPGAVVPQSDMEWSQSHSVSPPCEGGGSPAGRAVHRLHGAP